MVFCYNSLMFAPKKFQSGILTIWYPIEMWNMGIYDEIVRSVTPG